MIKKSLVILSCLLVLLASFPATSAAAGDDPKAKREALVDHSPVTAVLLSAVIPGAGQFYNFQFWKSIFVFTGTVGAGTLMAMALSSNKDEVGYQLGASVAFIGLYTYNLVDAGRTASKIRYGDIIIGGLPGTVSPYATADGGGVVVSLKW